MTIPIGAGIGIAKATAHGHPTPVTFFDGLISSAIAQNWPGHAAALTRQLTVELGKPGLIADGFNLYDIGVVIDKKPVIAIGRAQNGDLVITCTASSCGLVASSTQPTVAGKWADPRLRVTFGLSFSFSIDLPSTTGGALEVSPLQTLRVLRPDIDSMSLITDIAFFIDDVVGFFRGSRFVEDIQTAIAGNDFAKLVNGKFLGDALDPVNAALADLWAQGYPYLDVLVDTLDGTGELTSLSLAGAKPDELSLALIARGIDRSGVIEGTIEWPRTFGQTSKGNPYSAIALSWAQPAVFSLDTVSAVRMTDDTSFLPEVQPFVVPPEHEGTVSVTVCESPVEVAETPLADRIAAIPLETRTSALTAALGGSRTRLRALVGDAEISRQLKEIAFGTDDLLVTAVMDLPGEPGMFTGGTKVVSQMTTLWRDDDETTYRRHYRLREVATDTSLRVQVALGDGWRWTGKTFVAAPDGWSGVVTVQPLGAGETPSRRPRNWALNITKDAVFNGVTEVALNPQPLPPKDVDIASLNPQPLPPRWSQVLENAEIVTRRDGDVRIGGIKITDRLKKVGGVKLEVDDSLDIGRLHEALNPQRTSPSGKGITYGIDFRLIEYVPPVVR